MHVVFFGYGRHDDCSEVIMIVGLAMGLLAMALRR